MAIAQCPTGDTKNGLVNLKKSISIYKELFGTNSWEYANGLGNLSFCYSNKGSTNIAILYGHRAIETFENCFFGGQPPSFVLPPAGEKTSGTDSSATAIPEYKDRKISDSSGVECGKVYKFSDFAAKSLADLKTSKAGINLIHEAEAFRDTPYEDANERRLWTVGWGSKIDRRDADGAESNAYVDVHNVRQMRNTAMSDVDAKEG